MQSSLSHQTDYATREVDLARLGRALLRRRWWVAGPTAAAIVVALLFVNVVKPRYTSDARLLLENQNDFLTRADKGERLDPSAPDAEAVQSQIQLLTSRDLARRVVKKLELAGNPEFDPLANGMGAITRALVLLGIARDPTLLAPEERILEKFAEKVTVLSPARTRVLTIEFSSWSADLAARGANAIADAYIEMQQEAKREIARSAAQSLAVLVSDLQGRVAEAEAKVESYRAQTGLLVGANNATIPTQQLGELNNQLSIARATQADALAKANLLREMLRKKRIGEVPDVANNETIRRIFEQRVALRGRLALESRTLLPMHPHIKELEAQLSDLDQQWRAAAERIARTLENDARIAGARVENLTKTFEDQKRVAGAAGSEEVRLRDLERAARLLKEQLEIETAKYQEAVAREHVKATPADARVIQRALVSQTPSFPKKFPIVAFAAVASLALSTGAIAAVELLGGSAGPSTGDRRAGVNDGPGVDENVETSPHPQRRTTGSMEDDAPDEAERRRTATKSVKVLVIPCQSEDGGVAAAVSLGRRLARDGRALLLGVEPGNDAADNLIDWSAGPSMGFRELFDGRASLEDVIHQDKGSGLHVIAAAWPSSEGRGRDTLLIDAVSQAYDYIVCLVSENEARRLGGYGDLAFILGNGVASDSIGERLLRLGADVHFLMNDACGDLAAA